MKGFLIPSALALAILFGAPGTAGAQVLDAKMHHLRIGNVREWAEFPARAEASTFVRTFQARANTSEGALRLRQQDVKQNWRVFLNDRQLGMLVVDEADMVVYLPVPAGTLRNGQNTLRIEQEGAEPDDIRVGEIALVDRPVARALGEASVAVEVRDAATGRPIPAHITIVNTGGALQTVGTTPSKILAVRPGQVYTGSGRASLGLPAGTYTLYASRGFEYGADSTRLTLRPGDRKQLAFTIRREVPTDGWVGTDPHMHTLTYGGHGDATMEERVVTLAGEGVELAVMTEHNKYVDMDSVARALQLRDHFTPVVGNEVTSRVGHFNVFPVPTPQPADINMATDWKAVTAAIGPTMGAVILNHGRDVHNGYTPFGPGHHISVAGQNLDGWELPAIAMEVVNSGATLTDWMSLFRDWFGLLNRGYRLAPVGGSDSHDVSRYVVGQARTYIRARDTAPGEIDVQEAATALRQGRSMMAFGLLAELTVEGRFGPGDVAPASSSDSVRVSVRVLGPSWARANHITLYANGREIASRVLDGNTAPGIKWTGSWRLPRPKHDVYLVAIASGPGGSHPFWPIAKPYQPTSPEFTPYVIGASGAVWIDGDGDGRATPAFDYARSLIAESNGDLPSLLAKLAVYDEAVAVQAASLLYEGGLSASDSTLTTALAKAAPHVQTGFCQYAEQWQQAQHLRAGR